MIVIVSGFTILAMWLILKGCKLLHRHFMGNAASEFLNSNHRKNGKEKTEKGKGQEAEKGSDH